MAAVAYADGVETKFGLTAERMVKVWLSPGTMDADDTIAMPAVTGRQVHVLALHDEVDGDYPTSTGTANLTVDVSGGGSNHEYTILYMYGYPTEL